MKNIWIQTWAILNIPEEFIKEKDNFIVRYKDDITDTKSCFASFDEKMKSHVKNNWDLCYVSLMIFLLIYWTLDVFVDKN